MHQRSLAILRDYLRLARQSTAKRAFIELTERVYHTVPQLPGLPYVCLRVPTGGGKTLMACHAVGDTMREFLAVERGVVLWLVPTNTICEQTLQALRDTRHPYRQALQESIGGKPLTIMDLSEALYAQRGTLDGETCIIVSTLAALRVTDTEGRKIYETAGALEHHFSGLTPVQEEILERDVNGVLACSLANVLRLRRPAVIMDEAHNARTRLSFDTLARFSPSCILELTATPETTHRPESGYFASNVLHHVSAAELKAEQMIKMPVRLETRNNWQEVIAEALARRGTFRFQRHYYPLVGELKSEGEEFRCAQLIDSLQEVEFWVRNLERQPRYSFWLQTSSDKFYPDFVVQLRDGRWLVVEYKGAHLYDAPDAREKRALGDLWAARSNTRCLFCMLREDNLTTLPHLLKPLP